MPEYYAYRTGITCPIHIEHTEWGSFITKGISPLNFVERAYALGQLQPTYPLPAIQVKCFFHPDYINVVQYNGREGIYGPGFMTIHEWMKDDCNWDDHPATCKCETCRYWGT